MPYAPFHERFPEIADEETRSITTFNTSELPSDTYVLTEAYCDEVDCDCHRVFLNVISLNHKNLLATIAFGWKSKKFYATWMGDDDPQTLKGLKGPVLNLSSPQSELAPALLKQVNAVLLDRRYIERLKRHYKLFKQKIAMEEKNKQETDPVINGVSSPKIGRNDPCPCGSGKKYKKCCLSSEESEAVEQYKPLMQNPGKALVDVDDLDELSNSAVDLINAGKLDEAESICHALSRRYPDQADGIERMAMVYEARGNRKKAVEYYLKAAEFIRSHPNIEEEALEWVLDKVKELQA